MAGIEFTLEQLKEMVEADPQILLSGYEPDDVSDQTVDLIERTAEEIEDLMNRAAQGDPMAQYELADAIFIGEVPEDNELMLRLMLKAAIAGNANAQYQMGQMCGGIDDVHDLMEYSWYLLAARQNHAEAIAELGQMYFYGVAVDEDHNRAQELWEKAAKLGSTWAELLLSEHFS